MTDVSQSITINERTIERLVFQRGMERVVGKKIYSSECPRCHEEVDLKRRRKSKDDDEMVFAFESHRDYLGGHPCPTAGLTPEDAAGWVRETRERLGLGS